MSVTFTVTNPDGTVITPNVLTYTITDRFLDHSTLTFTTGLSGSTINCRGTVRVDGDGGAVLFLGYFGKIDMTRKGRLTFKCFGFSKLLEYRYAHPKTYVAPISMTLLFSHVPGSEGLLCQASSLVPDGVWSQYIIEPYVADIWAIYGMGYNWPLGGTIDVWLGTVQCTEVENYGDMVAYTWYQNGDALYVRTGNASKDPSTFPCYITNFKNVHITADSSIFPGAFGEDLTASNEPVYNVLTRFIRAQGDLYAFVPNADGTQHFMLITSNEPDPTSIYTYTEGDNIMDYSVGVLGGDYGLDCQVTRSKDNEIVAFVWWDKAGIWKERVDYESSFDIDQTYRAAGRAKEMFEHEDCITLAALENHSIRPGDWITVVLTAAAYAGTYVIRILEKTMKDGKMTLVLFYGTVDDI